MMLKNSHDHLSSIDNYQILIINEQLVMKLFKLYIFIWLILGLYRDIDFSSISKQNHFIEETLRAKFESYYKPNIDDWNSIKNSKE